MLVDLVCCCVSFVRWAFSAPPKNITLLMSFHACWNIFMSRLCFWFYEFNSWRNFVMKAHPEFSMRATLPPSLCHRIGALNLLLLLLSGDNFPSALEKRVRRRERKSKVNVPGWSLCKLTSYRKQTRFRSRRPSPLPTVAIPGSTICID